MFLFPLLLRIISQPPPVVPATPYNTAQLVARHNVLTKTKRDLQLLLPLFSEEKKSPFCGKFPDGSSSVPDGGGESRDIV